MSFSLYTHTHTHTHRRAAVRFWIHVRTPSATILHMNEQTKTAHFPRVRSRVCARPHKQAQHAALALSNLISHTAALCMRGSQPPTD